MTPTKLEQQLVRHEGLKLRPYKCTAGKITIGVGRNLEDKGISLDEAMFLLRQDIEECTKDLEKIFECFKAFPENVKLVLIDMRFNLGATGFRKFKKMIAVVKCSDFKNAAKEMRNSNWFHQVKTRGVTLYNMMKDS